MTFFTALVGNAILIQINPDYFTPSGYWLTLFMAIGIDLFYFSFLIRLGRKLDRIENFLDKI